MPYTISTPDSAFWLQDGTIAPTGGGTQVVYGKVSGVSRTLDLGSDTVPYHGVVSFNTTALNISSGQTYTVELVGNTASDFSGTEHAMATWDIQALQQDNRPFNNVYDEVVFRYARFRVTCTGTSPSITVLSFIKSLSDLTALTFSELVQVQNLLCDSIKGASTNFRAWMTGVAGGGINNDGKYPLSDGLGNVTYVDCPAQIYANSQFNSPIYYGAIADGTSHPASGYFSTLADLQVVYPFATSLNQEMDFLAWQKALYAGGNVKSQKLNYKMCNTNAASQTPLIAISGTFNAEGSGSVLDFSDMVEQTDSTQYLLNYNFADSSHWSNATIFDQYSILATTFGSGHAVMTDTGAQTHWSIRTSAADNNWTCVVWAHELSLYCAVGLTGGVMTSPDGLTWTTRTAASSNNWRSVCWSPELGLFVAVANSGTGTRVMTSTNGTTWTTRTSAGDSDWRSVCWSPELSLFVAVAVAGTNQVMTSPDGITWTVRTAASTNQWFSVCWSPDLNLFCAVASSGTGTRVMTSPDGITWTGRTSAADNNWTSVCWSSAKGMFVAVASSGTGNRVMTSYDGITWTIRTSSTDNSWNSVCWSANKSIFVAVAITGTGNRVMESKDGITWHTRTTPVDNSWFSICYSSDLNQFCSVSASGTGNRVMTAIIPSTYYNWGQQITLAPGKYTLTAECTATLGDSYYLGNTNPGYVSIFFSSSSPGEGYNPVGKSIFSRFNLTPSSTSDSKTLTTDFIVDTTTTLWAVFSGGGYANIDCTSLTIMKWLPNCAILATRDGSPEHFPIPLGFDGIQLVGPIAYNVNPVTGVKYKSFSNTDGNVIRFTNSMITAFGRGYSFGDGAYLTDFTNVNVYGCGTGIYTELGTFNAGENLRWYGGGVANCVIGIDGQGGMEITFYGSALDYNYQEVINCVGRYEFQSVHMETHQPVEADKPIFHIVGGQIAMYGGMILLTDTPLQSPCAPIKTEFSTAKFECFGTELYNVSSLTTGDGAGAMIEGPGRFVTHGWRNSGNPNVGPLVVSYAPVMDVLGGAGKFPEPNAYTLDPTGILIEGGNYPDAPPQIPFTGSISGSTLTITSTPPFSIAEGSILKAAGIKGKPLISYKAGGGTGFAGDYTISIPQTLSSRSMTAGTDGQIDRWNTIYGTLEWSNTYTVDGSNCVKFTKGTSSTGINSALKFLIPVSPNSVTLGFVKFLFPVDYAPADPTATAPLYFQLYWVRTVGNDAYGRPIIVRYLFTGDSTLYIPRAGSMEWQLRSLLTTYKDVTADASTETSPQSPEWATHLAIHVDTQSIPDGQVFYMANMICNVLR